MVIDFKNYFIEIYLSYNVVLISTVQESNSAICICKPFFIFFSIMVYHRVLNRFPCAL